MIDAEMKRKIPKLETWEDVLTSNVFGLLELIEYKHLLGLISMASNHKNVSVEDKLKDKKIKTVELWKYFKGIGEPDILVTLDDGTFFIIEVKYFGQEHNKKGNQVEDNSEETDKQEDGQLSKYLKINNKPSDFIIYLTANYQSIKQIEDSKSDSKDCLDKIYHIHWEQFNEYLGKIKNLEGIEKNIINKIIKYLDYKGFKHWAGFSYNKESYDIKITTKGFYGNK